MSAKCPNNEMIDKLLKIGHNFFMNSRYGEGNSDVNQQICKSRHQTPKEGPGHAMQADFSGTVFFFTNTQKFSFIILDLCADFLDFISIHRKPPWILGEMISGTNKAMCAICSFSLMFFIAQRGSEKVPSSLRRSPIFQLVVDAFIKDSNFWPGS